MPLNTTGITSSRLPVSQAGSSRVDFAKIVESRKVNGERELPHRDGLSGMQAPDNLARLPVELKSVPSLCQILAATTPNEFGRHSVSNATYEYSLANSDIRITGQGGKPRHFQFGLSPTGARSGQATPSPIYLIEGDDVSERLHNGSTRPLSSLHPLEQATVITALKNIVISSYNTTGWKVADPQNSALRRPAGSRTSLR
jgi:hypothetical protein